MTRTNNRPIALAPRPQRHRHLLSDQTSVVGPNIFHLSSTHKSTQHLSSLHPPLLVLALSAHRHNAFLLRPRLLAQLILINHHCLACTFICLLAIALETKVLLSNRQRQPEKEQLPIRAFRSTTAPTPAIVSKFFLSRCPCSPQCALPTRLSIHHQATMPLLLHIFQEQSGVDSERRSQTTLTLFLFLNVYFSSISRFSLLSFPFSLSFSQPARSHSSIKHHPNNPTINYLIHSHPHLPLPSITPCFHSQVFITCFISTILPSSSSPFQFLPSLVFF